MQHFIKVLGITTVLLASNAQDEKLSFPKNAALTYSGNGCVNKKRGFNRSTSNYKKNTKGKIKK